MPSCPVHGTPMKEWPSGDFFCPKKVGGRFCDVVVRADGTVTQKGTKTATSMTFYAGWYAPADTSATPDTLELSLDKPAYKPGDTATLRLVPEVMMRTRPSSQVNPTGTEWMLPSEAKVESTARCRSRRNVIASTVSAEAGGGAAAANSSDIMEASRLTRRTS